MESKKLKAKDLINVGIYTAIYIVIFFAVGMLNAIPVLYPLLYILIPLISGIPFMLFLTKVDKFGIGYDYVCYLRRILVLDGLYMDCPRWLCDFRRYFRLRSTDWKIQEL